MYPHPLVRAFNTLRPRQNGGHIPDDIFKYIFVNENEWISTKISLKFVPEGPIKDIPALVQIMAWRPLGGKPLSEPMMVSLLTHICVTRPQWAKYVKCCTSYGRHDNVESIHIFDWGQFVYEGKLIKRARHMDMHWILEMLWDFARYR